MKRFQYSQGFKDALFAALKKGDADSPALREAVEEGRHELVEAYLRSGVSHPTQYQDSHEMQGLLRTSQNERAIAEIQHSIAERRRAVAAAFEPA